MKDRQPTIFGIPIEGVSIEEILTYVKEGAGKPFWVVTANPEILLFARKDASYAHALRQADLRVVDGFGLWVMLRLFGRRAYRLTGVELSEALLRMAEERHWRVGLIGGSHACVPLISSSVIPAKAGIQPLHATVYWERGGTVLADGSDDDEGARARQRMALFDPQVLLVAFGHPKQERWIQRYLSDFSNVRAVVGVGGTFDFWSGRRKRAPFFFAANGFGMVLAFAVGAASYF